MGPHSFLALLLFGAVSGEETTRQRLVKRLFSDYPSLDPPPAAPVLIYNYIHITHIQEIVLLSPPPVPKNETEEVVWVHGQMFVRWADTRLQWDPSEFNGTTSLYLDRSKTNRYQNFHPNPWHPDLHIINRANGKDHDVNAWTNSYIGSSGFVFKSSRSTCNFDYAAYPFDRQSCPVVFYNGANMASSQFPEEERHMKAHGLKLSGADFGSFGEDKRGAQRRLGRNWIVTGTRKSFSYWTRDGFSSNRTGQDLDSVYQYLELYIEFQRHDPLMNVWVGVWLCCLGLLSVGALLAESTLVGLELGLTSILLHSLALAHFLAALPPATSALPPIVEMYGFSLGSGLVVVVWRLGWSGVPELRVPLAPAPFPLPRVHAALAALLAAAYALAFILVFAS